MRRWPAGIAVSLAVALAALDWRALAGGGHGVERLPLRAWLERPQTDEAAFVTDGPVRIAAMTEAVFTPRLPPKLSDVPAGGRYLLVAFVAPGGHRLLLAAESQVAALPHVALSGVTLAPERIGVPPAAIGELRRALPDLDTRHVTGLLWTWADARSR